MKLRHLLATCALALGSLHAQTPRGLYLGSAWYPEQWPEARWDADLTLMEQAHFNVVRIGEFAWSSIEPRENVYTFDWLDRAIALAAKHHLAVVIGTPTDAPPAWLTTKYPETLGVNEDGHTREHGGRRQFNYADPHYRELCRAIVAKLAERYGHNPAVIGWQIDNEYTDESFDPATKAQFQAFLQQRYGTLANLNRRWATAYWSQTYTAWSQIPMVNTHGNPGLLLEHKHFVTATWRSFQRNQIDVLRAHIDKRQFITTNIGGLAWSDNWDHNRIAADLDFASWDDYVGQGHLDVQKNAMLNDFVRGWKRANFWVMETQPASVNWAPVNNALSPGETRALAWQTIGHGADAVLYWQWRAALNGQEQYHGAIVGADGDPLPLYPELQKLGDEFTRVAPYLEGTSPHAEIALLHTYDSRWAIDFQPHTTRYDQQKVLLDFYRPLEQIAQSRGHAVDLIDPTQPAPLTQYKLLVAPSLNVIDDALATKLLAWVDAGGTLLLGPRSGMKDAYNALQPERQPGPLAAALGAKVEQFYALDKPVTLAPSGTADIWAEALTPTSPGTHADLTYQDPGGWLDHQPALVRHAYGKGTIALLGTIPDDATLAHLMQTFANSAQPAPFDAPAGIELCTRIGPRGTIHIAINHTDTAQQLTLPTSMRDLLTSNSAATLHLDPQGVAVLLDARGTR